MTIILSLPCTNTKLFVATHQDGCGITVSESSRGEFGAIADEADSLHHCLLRMIVLLNYVLSNSSTFPCSLIVVLNYLLMPPSRNEGDVLNYVSTHTSRNE